MRKWFKSLIKESVREEVCDIHYRLYDISDQIDHIDYQAPEDLSKILDKLDQIIMHLSHIRRT